MRRKPRLLALALPLVLFGCTPVPPDPTPSASPSVTPTVLPSPSVGPMPTPTPTPSPSVSPTPSPTPSASPTPSPSPTTPSDWPAAHNTGYPHGLPGDTRTPVTLKPYTGPATITAAGTVIDSADITTRINIRAAGVVIKNSRIRVSNAQALNINSEYHLTVVDTEIDGQGLDNSAGGISLIGDGSYTLLRVNAHGSGDIARANWGGVAIVDSWLHDVRCLQSSCHNDVIQTTDGSCTIGTDSLGPVKGSSDTDPTHKCIRIVHNRLENKHTQTSCILLKADQGAIHDVLVADNLFNGGGYTVYWYDANYRATGGVIKDNRFMRAPGGYWPKGGYHGPAAFNAVQSPQWTNNRWHDTGEVIPG